METYNTEEEQVEALRRWWSENGRSIVLAVVVALSAGFGWQAWTSHQEKSTAAASDVYQTLLQNMSVQQMTQTDRQKIDELALQLKDKYPDSAYAQFAALHMARIAVAESKLTEAESELRWVLTRAVKGSDVAEITELRLARVLAAQDQLPAALEILERSPSEQYAAAYAMAKGDVLLQMERIDEAKIAYQEALSLAAELEGGVNLSVIEQKLQNLEPVSPRQLSALADGSNTGTEE